jgi:hypothetical protein
MEYAIICLSIILGIIMWIIINNNNSNRRNEVKEKFLVKSKDKYWLKGIEMVHPQSETEEEAIE